MGSTYDRLEWAQVLRFPESLAKDARPPEELVFGSARFGAAPAGGGGAGSSAAPATSRASSLTRLVSLASAMKN